MTLALAVGGSGDVTSALISGFGVVVSISPPRSAFPLMSPFKDGRSVLTSTPPFSDGGLALTSASILIPKSPLVVAAGLDVLAAI